MLSSIEQIVERPITTDIVTKAHEKSVEMGTLKNSITKGAGNLVGFVGEGVFHSFLLDQQQQASWANTYEHDLILNNTASTAITIDVKSKKTNYIPKLEYDCSVAALNTKQQCDIYVFTRIKGDMSVGWILGFLPKGAYFEEATFMEKGAVDPSNGWKVKTDCYQVPIEKLRPIDELITEHADC